MQELITTIPEQPVFEVSEDKRCAWTELEYCRREVNYTADPDVVKSKRDECVRELRKIQIPGFRRGKAPDQAIKSRCKDRIDNWVTNQMVDHAFDDIIFELNIKPIGTPKVTDFKLNGNNFSCTMVINIKPQFELNKYLELEVPRPDVIDVEAHVEMGIQNLRIQFGDVVPYGENDVVADGDQVTLDYKAGEEPTVEGKLLVIGENAEPHIDQQILGMKAGETREFDLNDMHCKVTVHMGTKKVPCPADDELAKKAGLNSFDELRQKLSIITAEKIRNQENNAIRQQICKQLVAGHEFEVPEFLNLPEAQALAAQNGINWRVLKDDEKEVFLKSAKDNVKLSLILDSIRENEPETILSESEVEQLLTARLKAQGQDPQKFLVDAQKSGRLFGFMAQLRDEYTLQWVVDKAKIID